MLVGLLSDAHCNAGALQVAVDQLAPRVDEILFAGDAVYEYRFSNEVVEIARENHFRCVLGNHEMVFLSDNGAVARSAPWVRAANVEYVASMPDRVDTVIGGKRLAMVHGSPFAPHSDYVVPGSPPLRRVGELGVDILVLGHTHRPMVERVDGCLVINPGSVGESRDPRARHRLTYAVLDTDTDEVEIVEFSDPRT